MDQLADWIQPDHRGPLSLCLNMSNVGWQKDLNGYHFVSDPRVARQSTSPLFPHARFGPASVDRLATVRVGVWRKVNRCGVMEYVVGFRGTGIGKQGMFADLGDDLILAGIRAAPTQCDLNIVQEGRIILDILIKERAITPSQIVLAGYSLGGSAALCLASQTPGVRALSFFGGAPPTFPFKTGPGPDRATHYHVVGDLVSSHMDPSAAKVVRVDKGFTDFSLIAPHLSGRFLRNDRPDFPAKILSASDEDAKFVMWATGVAEAPTNPQHTLLWNALKKIGTAILQFSGVTEFDSGTSMLNQLETAAAGAVACNSPIPGSQRQIEGGCAEDTPGGAICRGYGYGVWCNPGTEGEEEEEEEDEEL